MRNSKPFIYFNSISPPAWRKIWIVLIAVYSVTIPLGAITNSDLKNQIAKFEKDLNETLKILDGIDTRSINIRNKVLDVTDDTGELLSHFQSGVDLLDDFGADAVNLVDDSIEEIRQLVAEEIEGREDFLANEVDAYRGNLLQLVSDLESIISELGSFSDAIDPIELELTGIRRLIESLPDKALYPSYRAFEGIRSASAQSQSGITNMVFYEGVGPQPSQPSWDFSNINLLSRMELEIKELLETISAGVDERDQILLRKTREIRTTAASLQGVAKIGVLLGKFLRGKGEVKQKTATVGGVEVVAAVEASYKENLIGGIGIVLEGVSEIAGAGAEALLERIKFLTLLRIELERHLSFPDNGRLAIYYLPREHSGLLQFVRDVVTVTVEKNEELGLSNRIDAARVHLDAGNRRLERGEYRRSYDSYKSAYETVTGLEVQASLALSPVDSNSYVVSWESEDGGDYKVERSSNLSDWEAFAEVENTSGGQTGIEFTPTVQREFFTIIKKPRKENH